MKSILKKICARAGYDIRKLPKTKPSVISDTVDYLRGDFDAEAFDIINKSKAFTMTSPERIFSLIEAVRHLVRANIRGSIVECGVWKGGSMMAAAVALQKCGDTSRDLYLYDTFEGMSEPTAADASLGGIAAAALLQQQDPDEEHSIWCRATIDIVKDAMGQSQYPSDKIHYIAGKVEETIPGIIPEKIALLRLDTDWYESTKHEFEHLYPKLVPGGILIIDDYGHWQGARKATDEFLATLPRLPFLSRIDYTGRLAVKPHE